MLSMPLVATAASLFGTAEKYDIETDTWSDIAPMRTPRRNVGK